ncbi:hypothetical protein Droror1_Dr00011978 [Drosera rotundifolia]
MVKLSFKSRKPICAVMPGLDNARKKREKKYFHKYSEFVICAVMSVHKYFQKSSPVAPYIGMVFATVEEAKNYYDEYGKQHWFCPRQRDIKRGIPRSDQITNILLVCQRHGKHRKSEQTYAVEQKRYTVATEADAGGVKGKRGKARTSSSVRLGCQAAM